jgi:hypothetical protein
MAAPVSTARACWLPLFSVSFLLSSISSHLLPMSFLTRSMASLAIIPVFLSLLVAAMPAAEPMVTIGAELLERANGANIIGYSASGTTCKSPSNDCKDTNK